jgi:hypothetical protein
MDKKDQAVDKHHWDTRLAIKHGLYLKLEQHKIDGRSAMGQAIAKSRAALVDMFPNGADAAAQILISQIVYKALRLELFTSWDMATGEGTPTAISHYIILSNSLRNDLNALIVMAERQAPAQVPDIKEYLKKIAQVGEVDRG